jgi:hypothetical protein
LSEQSSVSGNSGFALGVRKEVQIERDTGAEEIEHGEGIS